MTKISLMVSVLLATFSMVQAQEIKKIFDGTQAFCSEPATARYFDTDKVIRTSVVNNELVIEASICVNGKWVKDTNLKLNQFTTFEGLNVTEAYYKFSLWVKPTDTEKYTEIKLANFENSSVAKVSLSQLRVVNAKSVDLSVQSMRDTKASSGYQDIDFVTWGSTRLTF